MFHKIKKTFQNHASGKKQSDDGEPLLAGSGQLRRSHQGTRQSNVKASPVPFPSFGRRRNDRDSRGLSSIQETRVPQTRPYTTSSPHHSPRRSQHSTSHSIPSDVNGRPSTSTRAESVVSSSGSHRTTSNMNRASGNSTVLVLQGRSSRDEQRPSSASRNEPHSSIARYIAVGRSNIKSEGNSRPQTRHESKNVYNQQSSSYNHSTTEASHVPRSFEQARNTTGFTSYDEWCNRPK